MGASYASRLNPSGPACCLWCFFFFFFNFLEMFPFTCWPVGQDKHWVMELRTVSTSLLMNHSQTSPQANHPNHRNGVSYSSVMV